MHLSSLRILPLILAIAILSGCAKMNDISVTGVKNVTLKGVNKKQIRLSVEIEIDNPNNRKITITDISFHAWLNNREFGTLKVNEPIVIIPCSRKAYPTELEIELHTIADALRLFTSSPNDILKRMEVEGFIKGRSFPVRKTIQVPRQPFSNLVNSL